jgi:hypothetical protein
VSRLNASLIFNDRLGEIGDEEDWPLNGRPQTFADDDVIRPGRPPKPHDDVIKPGRPGEHLAHPHQHLLSHYGNKFNLGLEDLISNGRPPTILLGGTDEDEESEGLETGDGPEEEEEEDEGHGDDDVDDEDGKAGSGGYNHGFHSYHTLQLLYKNKTAGSDDADRPPPSPRPMLPSYYPQLASQYDGEDDLELSSLKPNFTQVSVL